MNNIEDKNAGFMGTAASSQSSRYTGLLRFLAYQLIWWMLVYSVKIEAQSGVAQLSNLLALIVSVVSLNLIISRKKTSRPRLLMMALVVFGFAVDSISISLGLIETAPTYQLMKNLSVGPAWLFAIWISFAAMCIISVSPDSRKLFSTSLKRAATLFVLVLSGAIGGPLSYMVGEPLGVMTLPMRPNSIIVLGIQWALLFPAFLVTAWFVQNSDTKIPT